MIALNTESLPRFGIPLDSVNLKKRVFWMTMIFTGASLNWYISVSTIALSDITAIYNTSCFFTYILSTIFLHEPFTWLKLGAVMISILGISFISLWESFVLYHSFTTKEVIGYGSAIMASICAAGYEVMYTKIAVPKTPSLFFSIYVTGLVGLVTLLLGPIVFPLLHFTGLETFQLPALQQWPLILLVAALGISFNTLFLLVITFSGPVFAAVGILLSIPFTSIADWYFTHSVFGWNFLVGSVCITIGFTLLQLDTTVFDKGQQQIEEEQEPLL